NTIHQSQELTTWRTNSPSSADSTPPPLSNAGGCSIAPPPPFASVTLFFFKRVPTRCRREVLAGSKPLPVACSNVPQKITVIGEHQPRRPPLGSRRAAC